MSRSAAVRLAGVMALLLAGVWIIVSRLTLTYDLSYFLPEPRSDAERVLIDRVGQGPGSQILFVTLPGEADGLALADGLRGMEGLRRVLPETPDLSPGALPVPLFQHRYLLADVDLSAEGLRNALQQRLRDLTTMDDPGYLALLAADPYLASLGVLERVVGQLGEETLRLPDGTPFLMVETEAPAFDLGGQARVVAALEAYMAANGAAEARVYGAGAYGVGLQDSVRRESTMFSLAAAAVLTALLWVSYRGIGAVLVASLPLAAGAVAGLAVLSLAFPQVHGITLAFGFTLMGVTVDYGLHVLSHTRRTGPDGLAAVWPTLLLSVVSSALAFLSFTVSGSRGLVQLGVFSAVGIVTAAVVAGVLLPRLSTVVVPAPAPDAGGDAPRDPAYRFWPLAAVAAAGALLLLVKPAIWNNDLSSMTPVPPQTLAVDRQLRQAAGAPDIRYLVATRGAGQDEVLAGVEALEAVLNRAQADGVLDSYRAVTALVPSHETQRQRRQRLRTVDLQRNLATALQGLPFRPAALQPFLEGVAQAAAGDTWVNPRDYDHTPLAGLVDAMLYRNDEGWTALTFLVGLADAGALAARLGSVPDAVLVDLRGASQSLLSGYRTRLLEILAGALVVIAALLAFTLGSLRRWLWVLGTLSASLLLCVGVVVHVIGSLSLFDLVAATLVAGLGLDYALFFSRPPGSRHEQRDTRHALSVCFASTGVVFALLGLSSIPVLHGIGVTVAVGVTVAFTLAGLGCYSRPGN